jgi:nucleoid DNA-binding protein
MTLVQLETMLAERLGMAPEDASRAVRGALTLVAERLAAGEAVKLAGFGRFETRERPARRSKDPRDGRNLDVPARRRPVFKASRLLVARIEGVD